MDSDKMSEAFDLIAKYAEREQWIPIGFRGFYVGEWSIVVNGTKDETQGIPPFHASVTKPQMLGVMLVNPFGGTVAGWRDMEDQFCADMKAALESAAGQS